MLMMADKVIMADMEIDHSSLGVGVVRCALFRMMHLHYSGREEELASHSS
jgi:hypothetical protein